MGAVAGLGAVQAYRLLLAGRVERWRGRLEDDPEGEPDTAAPVTEPAERASTAADPHPAVEGAAS